MSGPGPTAAGTEQRCEQLVAVLVGLASLDFTRRAPVGTSGDSLDAVAVGLNMLAEELEEAVVTRAELTAANDALRASEDRLALAIAASDQGLWDWDIVRDEAYLSPEYWQIIGYEDGQRRAAFAFFQSLVHPDDVARVRKAMEEHLQGLSPQAVIEYRVRRKSGEYLWIRGVGRVTARGADGAPLRMVGVVTDITARKQAEAERERLLVAIDQAEEMMIVTDTVGSITYVNPAFETVTGYSSAEIVGQNLSLLNSGVGDEAEYHRLWQTIGGGQPWHGTTVNKRKDGTHYTQDAIISPVRSEGGVITGYVAMARDVTRDLSLKAQLLQFQKMEGIGVLAGGIAHEFNNIIAAILSYTGFALESVREEAPIRADLLEIEAGGNRAAELVHELLAFSRKQLLRPVRLNLNRTVASMERTLRRVIGDDVELLHVLAPDLGLVKADPVQLEQVILKLVVNAREAMRQGGTLTILTANADPDVRGAGEPASYVMLEVTDSGTGMDEATKARIFEPFYTTKGLGKGTGLGLSAVYGVVKQSGGDIRIESEVGKGTSFKIFLPRDLTASGPPAATPSTARQSVPEAETILLVEHEEALRKVARRSLDAAGYTVLTAADGNEGLLTAAQHPGNIHLLLTDISTSEMSGRKLADRLTTTRPLLKVLYMSGCTDDVFGHHDALGTGIAVVGKPFSSAELRRKVRQVLDGGGTHLPA